MVRNVKLLNCRGIEQVRRLLARGLFGTILEISLETGETRKGYLCAKD